MVANNRDLTVQFKGDSSDLESASKKATKSMHNVGEAASGSGGLLSKLTPVIDPISLVAQGFELLWSTGMDVVKIGIESAKSQAGLKGVLEKVTKATDDQVTASENWITSLSLHVGIIDDDLRPAYERLIGATGNVQTAQELLKLAIDYSAGSGKNFNTVADAFVKASGGNEGALGRLGIAVHDANGKVKPLADIIQTLHDRYDGLAAKVADQDPLQKAAVGWHDLQAKIGVEVLPILAKVVDFFDNKIVPAVGRFVDQLKTKLGPVITEVLWPAVKKLISSLGDLAAAFDFAGTHSDKAGDKFSVLTFIIHLVAGAFDAVSVAIEGVSAWLQQGNQWFADIKQWGVDAAKEIAGAWSTLAKFLSDLTDPVRLVWDKLFRWIIDIWNKLSGAGKFVGLNMPSINMPGGKSAPSASGQAATSSTGSVININLPSGTDGHAVVSALRTYGVRVGGLDLALNATR